MAPQSTQTNCRNQSGLLLVTEWRMQIVYFPLAQLLRTTDRPSLMNHRLLWTMVDWECTKYQKS